MADDPRGNAPRLDRHQRRAILKDDAAWVGKPLKFGGDPRAIQANTRHLALLLIDNPRKDRASQFAAFAETLLDATVGHNVTGPVACARGCSHCCTTFVSATAPEVLRLARAVRGDAAKVARVDAAGRDAQSIPQAERERRRIVCPILENQACSAYASRPVVCRYVLSTSLPACVRIFTQNSTEALPYPDGATGLRSTVVVIMKAAMVLAGLSHQHIELHHALATALAVEDAEARWLAGEPVFEAVAVDQVDRESSHLKGLIDALVGAVRPTI